MSNIGKIDGQRLIVVDNEITVNIATDAQLETGTQAELENLGVTAWQTKQVKTDLTADLANKTNLDMDNLSSVGKSTISSLGTPDFSSVMTWNIPAEGQTYIVPYDCLLSVYTGNGDKIVITFNDNTNFLFYSTSAVTLNHTAVVPKGTELYVRTKVDNNIQSYIYKLKGVV